ncbi:MAG: ERCC4 domain-containing protein [Candidatus Caldarchaeales archaeon]
MIVVDSNEAAEAPEICEALRRRAEVAVRPLEAGDYFVLGSQGSVLIERKRVLDFLSSLKGRLWDQLDRMRQHEGPKLILLEGNIAGYRRTGWNETAVLALMDKIVLEMGVPIVPVPDSNATVTYILWKDRRLGSPPERREYPLRVARRDMTPAERALYALEGMCGHKTAIALLNHFGTLGDLICFVRSNPFPVVESRLGEVKVGGRRIPYSIVRTIYETVNAAFGTGG